ncbi:MAG TPA: protein kinase [Kofleriaceae bacterium]|nr:protein kinase [Kofleriaceae bacterium]
MDAEPDPLIGGIIADRYRILAPLGRGGMGAVYRVEHLMMKKELALKLLHPELGRLEEVAKRFEREAEAAARLDHPNIIAVTDFGRTAEGMLFLVMELLEGPSLAHEIRPDGNQGRPLGTARAVHIMKQILRALEKAHQSGVVHRDLKPENIVLVERDGEEDIVKLLDFGIAKITSGPSESKEVLTQAGVVFGTPEYLSPEQAMGEEADGRADLYAAGVMLYEMLTGRRPFEAESKVEVLSMHLTRDAEPMHKVAPEADIPIELERVVERAMAKKRQERFASAATFLEAIEGKIQPLGPAPSATARYLTEAPARGWRWLVQRAREAGVPWPRAFVGGAAALALALVTLLVVARRAERPRPPAPEIAADLRQAEALLARGELEGARAALQQLLSSHPASARVRYLFGNLDYADGERERALGDYREAIRLDKGYRNDPLLRANVRALLDRRAEGLSALQLLADDVGAPALDDIVACAKGCRDDRVRAKAVEAAIKLGGTALIAKEGKPASDDDEASLDKLQKGKSCRDRKAAALALIASGNPKYLEALKDARDRRGGFFGVQQINGCMLRELNAAIRKWEAEK